MSHCIYKLYYHLIFSVKNRSRLLAPEIEDKIFSHIIEKCSDKRCNVIEINGVEDHVHILVKAIPSVSISQLVKHVKGSSSHWINSNKLTAQRFSWQVGYNAITVSESKVQVVTSYIKKQKTHHASQSFDSGQQGLIGLLPPGID